MAKNAPGGKERLLDAARQLFGSSTYDQVGVAQLLEIAGVQAPTLYHHFGDKEGLYMTWACQELNLVGRAMQALSEFSTSRQALEVCGEILAKRLSFDPRVLLRDAERLQRAESREKVMDCFQENLYNPLYSVLVKGIHKGEIHDEPIAMLAETFLSGALSLGKFGWRGADTASEGASWWARIFLQGCGTRR
jgi:AcrR family transcriptional regulator